MKFISAVVIALFSATVASAQTVPAPRVAPLYSIKGLMSDSTLKKDPLGTLQIPGSYLNGGLSKLNPVEIASALQPVNINDAQIVYSRMPVVGLTPTDNMPVAKLSDDNYKMPVKRFKVIDPLKAVATDKPNP